MIVACLALFVSLTGTSIAARHYLTTSTEQIKASVIKQLKGAKGPRGYQGAQGAKGDTGSAGAQGPSGVVTTVNLTGYTASLAGYVSGWVFFGTTVSVTTTASQRLTSAAEATLGSTASTSGQTFYFGLCYQASTGGTISSFPGDEVGTNYSVSKVYPDMRTFATAQSVVPGTGTWEVGFCVINYNANAINNNSNVSGWVQVTNRLLILRRAPSLGREGARAVET